jgi:hypothetical protein
MMKIHIFKKYTLIFFISLLMVGCATTHHRLFDSDSSQLQLRSIQTRAFETTDREKTLRTVIATLQDLGFVIDKADAQLGFISATKLHGYILRITVTVRPRGETALLVRANAQYGGAPQYGMKPVVDPEPYQNFFSALEKAMFLTGQEVD